MPNTSTVARAGENVRNGKTQVQWEFKKPYRQFRSPGIEVPHAVRAGIPV